MTVDARFADGQSAVVVAHRSAEMGGRAENTLAWLEYAIGLGVDVVHINPRKTADGRYVLMHDPTLNRMTDVETVYANGPPGGPTRAQLGGKDFVGYYTLDEIGALGIASGAGDGVQKVPTLGEALNLVNGRAIVLLGLKSYDLDSFVADLRAADPRGILLFELYVSGTDQSALKELAAAAGIGVHVALYGSTDFLKDLNGIYDQLGPLLRGVHVRRAGVTPAFLARVEELNLHLIVSGWYSGEDAALLEGDAGPWAEAFAIATGVATDQPAAVLELLGR